jgi:hypothetical protein
MEIDPGLREAWKHHMRSRRIEGVAAGVGFVIFLLVLWWLDLSSTDRAILFVGALVVFSFLHTKWRLKAMQIRLAEMHDEIDKLRGNQPEDHTLTELTSELAIDQSNAAFDRYHKHVNKGTAQPRP